MYLVDKAIQRRLKDIFGGNPAVWQGDYSIKGASINASKALMVHNIQELHPSCMLWVVDDLNVIPIAAKELSVWNNAQVFPLTKESSGLMSKKIFAHLVSNVHLNNKSIVVTTKDVLKRLKLPSALEIKKKTITITNGDTIDLIDTFNRLIDIGYSVSDSLILTPGTYIKKGGVISLFPVNAEYPVKIELFDNQVDQIYSCHPVTQELIENLKGLQIIPIEYDVCNLPLMECFKERIVLFDEIDAIKDLGKMTISIVPFTEEEGANEYELNFTSVLRFHSPLEFTEDLKKKISGAWKTIIFTQDQEKVWKLIIDQGITNENLKNIQIIEKMGIVENIHSDLTQDNDDNFEQHYYDTLLHTKESELRKKVYFPESFQGIEDKILIVTDKVIFGHFDAPVKTRTQADATFLANLNPGDFVVHIDHGIGQFVGVDTKTVDDITREYLNIEYAKGDRLFVPVDQADKINKYIGASGEHAPNLTRLGSADWNTVTVKARKETLELAKDLLDLYAKRETAKGYSYLEEHTKDSMLEKFIDYFPYVDTPGQTKAWAEIKEDMTHEKPMDRLLCGDVGFGKTEIAMRAAINAVAHGKQVAFIAPITILVDQHFQTFTKRINDLDITIGMLCRFNTAEEQRKTIDGLKKGMIDIVIGTHRLLQPDIGFKDLGLVIIDEEQRFGVRQKEKFKELRHEVDILSLTATPIPRTLNLGLSGLRDISTITTPPPGRLSIVTEVRRFSLTLIRDVILKELSRGGQIYVLHNRVQTIESFREKLQNLIPEAKFVVAHGKLSSDDLEERIMAFKNAEYDVLISSTIIENGIDLANANTLIVDRAERLGLAQAYQLRGRVGRGKKQAYAYFLYHSQKLDDTAKKRLRAIVEASELGSGFQIAMRDLEIRGAGDILGAKQHGSINSIGVSHFTRLLKKAVDEIKKGKTDTEILDKPIEETAIELPVTAYIPKEYIERSSEKLKYYQRMAGCNDVTFLKELREEVIENYGPLPEETHNLFKILHLKIVASEAGLLQVKEAYIDKKPWINLLLGKKVTPEAIFNLLELNGEWLISGQSLMIPKSKLGKTPLETLIENVEILGREGDRKKHKSARQKKGADGDQEKDPGLCKKK